MSFNASSLDSSSIHTPQRQSTAKSESLLSAQRDDFTQQYIQNLGLYDRPKIRQPSSQEADSLPTPQNPQNPQGQPPQPRLRLIFEPDPLNNFLVTNPTAIFKFIRPDRFLLLKETEQAMVVDKLGEALRKCVFNAHLISE